MHSSLARQCARCIFQREYSHGRPRYNAIFHARGNERSHRVLTHREVIRCPEELATPPGAVTRNFSALQVISPPLRRITYRRPFISATNADKYKLNDEGAPRSPSVASLATFYLLTLYQSFGAMSRGNLSGGNFCEETGLSNKRIRSG